MKKQLILKVLDMLDRESKVPTMDELGLNEEQYGEILEIVKGSYFISDVDILRDAGNKVYMCHTNKCKITVQGIEYLEQNRSMLE